MALKQIRCHTVLYTEGTLLTGCTPHIGLCCIHIFSSQGPVVVSFSVLTDTKYSSLQLDGKTYSVL